MVWIHASSISANMVDLKPLRDGAFIDLVGDSVGMVTSVVEIAHPVTLLRDKARPDPACSGFLDMYPEQLVDGFPTVFGHIGEGVTAATKFPVIFRGTKPLSTFQAIEIMDHLAILHSFPYRVNDLLQEAFIV
jgi:hypothetical protein